MQLMKSKANRLSVREKRRSAALQRNMKESESVSSSDGSSSGDLLTALTRKQSELSAAGMLVSVPAQ